MHLLNVILYKKSVKDIDSIKLVLNYDDVTRLRLSQQVSFEGYFLQVSHILAAVFPQVADKPYIGAK